MVIYNLPNDFNSTEEQGKPVVIRSYQSRTSSPNNKSIIHQNMVDIIISGKKTIIDAYNITKLEALPAVIETFIKATNDHDSDAFVSTFADDALVNDFARNFWGKGQIKEWADKEMIEPKVTFKADEIVEHYGDFFITALTDGNYDKSKSPDPAYLDYFFTVKSGKIVKMIVIKNKKKSASV